VRRGGDFLIYALHASRVWGVGVWGPNSINLGSTLSIISLSAFSFIQRAARHLKSQLAPDLKCMEKFVSLKKGEREYHNM
jgi:hypothetical protein